MKVATIGSGIHWLLVVMAFAANPATDDAETQILRRTIERQSKEIELLRAQVDALTRRLRDLAPTTAPVTRPAATHNIQTVLFVCDKHSGSHSVQGTMGYDVAQALEQLRPAQKFNIFRHDRKGVTAMAEGFFLAATAENRRRAGVFLQGASMEAAGDELGAAVKFAINYRPDLIWVISTGEVKSIEATLKAVAAANTGRIPIHTTLKYASKWNPAHQHFLWQLAKDSGGMCVGGDGQPADEPVVPVPMGATPNRPAPPTTRPTPIRINP